MTMNNYDYDFFIEKFSAIPDERWCVGSLVDSAERSCALGHCGVRNTNQWDAFIYEGVNITVNPIWVEGRALRNILDCNVGALNNGDDLRYQQPTPKARILAALYDVKARAEAALDAYELRELQPTTKPEQKEELCEQQ